MAPLLFELHPVALIDGYEKHATHFVSKRPSDLSCKSYASLDVESHEFPNARAFGYFETEATARHIEERDVVFAPI